MAQTSLAVANRSLALKDKVPPKAHTLFVGINPAVRSAQVGHYYAHPTNMFWRLVSDSRLAPRALTASDDDAMVMEGFGFTDVVKRPSAKASDLGSSEFVNARLRLATIVRAHGVRTICFVSKTSARAFLEDPTKEVAYGPQSEPFEGAAVWFLPSTSGQSRGDSSYDEKLVEFQRLARHVAAYCAWGSAKAAQPKSRLASLRAYARRLVGSGQPSTSP